MEWEKSGREIDPYEYFHKRFDEVKDEEWEKQPDERLWYIPPGTKSVATSLINYRAAGVKQLQIYLSRCLEAPWEISHLEEQFEITLGEVVVRGGVDRILHWEMDDYYLVEDLKTGKVSETEEDDIRQLGFYAFVARELWDVPVVNGRYWYTKVDRPSKTFDLAKFDRDYWTEEFRRLGEIIDNRLFLPNPGKTCGICPVKPWCKVNGWLEIGEPLHEG